MFGKLRAQVAGMVAEVRGEVEKRSREAAEAAERDRATIKEAFGKRDGAFNLLFQRFEAVEASVKELRERRGADPELVKEVAAFRAEMAEARGEMRRLRGKVYKDPEFHQPQKREPEPEEDPLVGLMGGPGWVP